MSVVSVNVTNIPYRVLCIAACQVEGRYWKLGEVYESNTDLATNYSSFFETFAGDVYLSAPTDFFVDLDGTLRVRGLYGWIDSKTSVTTINPPGAASDPDRDATDGTLLFDKSSTELIFVWDQLSHKVVPGTKIHPHVHWTATSEDEGNVMWTLDYKLFDIGGDTTGDWTATTAITAVANQTHRITSFDDILIPADALSAEVGFKISRIGGDDADTYDEDAKMFEFDYHYMTNVILGSGREYQA